MSAHPGASMGSATQRGISTLVIVVALYVITALVVVFANRSLVFEQRTSANQYRATLAQEAAEAGLEWTLAMLGRRGGIDALCQSSPEPTQSSFRERYLVSDPTTGRLTPRAGTVHAACVTDQAGTGWNCSCPLAGTAPAPVLPTSTTGYRPAFAVLLQSSPAAGSIGVSSYGCTDVIGSTTCGGDAAARVAVGLGPVPALATPPGAPLVVRGRVSVGEAAVAVTNSDAATGGVTVNAGLGIDAPNLHIATVPGTPPRSSLAGNDPSLRATTEAQMFATFFGMSKAAYRALPGVLRLTCPCTEDMLAAAHAGTERARVFWLDGDLTMNAGASLGTVTDPVIVVVDGRIALQGDVGIVGVIYGASIGWSDAGSSGALLQGAAISEGDYTASGTPHHFYDPRVFAVLRHGSAAFARIPGSWRDHGF